MGAHTYTRDDQTLPLSLSRASLWECPREQSSLRQTGSQCADMHRQVALFLILLEVFCICSSHLLSAESPTPARLVSWPGKARPGKMLLYIVKCTRRVLDTLMDRFGSAMHVDLIVESDSPRCSISLCACTCACRPLSKCGMWSVVHAHWAGLSKSYRRVEQLARHTQSKASKFSACDSLFLSSSHSITHS